MAYQIILAASGTELASLVNAAIKLGWKPTGGLAIGASGLYQAMIKETTV